MNTLDRWAKAKYQEIIEKVTLDRMIEEGELSKSSAMCRVLEQDIKIAEWRCRVIVEDDMLNDDQAIENRQHVTYQQFDHLRKKLAADHAWERWQQERLDK